MKLDLHTQTFKTADDAVAQLIADGFDRVDYDPIYPYLLVYDDGDATMARPAWCDRRQRYIIEGIRL